MLHTRLEPSPSGLQLSVITTWLLSLAGMCLAAPLAGCGSNPPAATIRWLREPREVAWVKAAENPRLLYTVSAESRTSRHTALMLVGSGEEVSFTVGSDSDPNGNAPATPGHELRRAAVLESPRGLTINDHTFVLIIEEDREGARQVVLIKWGESPDEATATALSGTRGAIAFDVAPCGAELCVLTARAQEPHSAELVLTRLESDGGQTAQPLALSDTDHLLRALYLLPLSDRLEIVWATCEGCESLDYDNWEERIYAVSSRVSRLSLSVDGAPIGEPETIFDWPALIEPADAAVHGDDAWLLFWKMSDHEAPGCGPRGYCPIPRELVAARWSPGMDEAHIGAPLAVSELAYLAALSRGGGSIIALWRTEDESDRYRRNLHLAELAVPDGDPGGEPVALPAATYTPLLFRDDWSAAPNVLPFAFTDGLAALADGGPAGFRVAMSYRDHPPGSPLQCGEAVRAGVFYAQVSTDGEILQSSPHQSLLAVEPTCGDSGGCAHAQGPKQAPLPLTLLLVAALAIRRRARAPGH